MANASHTFIPPIGVSLTVNVGSCFSCCQANMCPPNWHRAGTDLPEPVLMKAAAAALSVIHHTPHSSSNTSFKSSRSPTRGSACLRGCSPLCNCHLIKAPECRTSVYFFKYARLDLPARKCLAYFNCPQRSRKHSEELLLHFRSSSDPCSCNKEGIANLQTDNCAEQ